MTSHSTKAPRSHLKGAPLFYPEPPDDSQVIYDYLKHTRLPTFKEGELEEFARWLCVAVTNLSHLATTSWKGQVLGPSHSSSYPKASRQPETLTQHSLGWERSQDTTRRH